MNECHRSSPPLSFDAADAPVAATPLIAAAPHVDWISDESAWANLQVEWDALAGENPMATFAWASSWWDAFGQGKQLAIALVRDVHQNLIAIAPWYREITRSGTRRIAVLGDGSACSDYVGLLCESSITSHAAHSLATDLQHRRFDLLEITGHRMDNGPVQALAQACCSGGATVVSHPIESAWATQLCPSWLLFQKSITKSFRRKMIKATQRLESGEFTARVADQPDQLKDAWPVFVRLHQQRRAMLKEPGCFADPRFERFLHQATARLIAQGQAYIGLIEHQGKPIAANLVLCSTQTHYMYQSGLDPAAMPFEPGHLINTFAILNAIAKGAACFDFLRGDEPYKARWNAERQELGRTRIVPSHWASQLRHRAWRVGDTAKRWLKQSRRVTTAESTND